MPHQVVLAAADGSTAAIAIHKSFAAHTLGSGRTIRLGTAARTG
jgi:hypothetical protein